MSLDSFGQTNFNLKNKKPNELTMVGVELFSKKKLSLPLSSNKKMTQKCKLYILR